MMVELLDLVNKVVVESNKFYIEHNKAAGTRARMLCQEIKKKATELRNDIQKTKNSIKEK